MHKRNLKDESGSVTNLHVCVSGRGRALLWINRALLLLSAYCPLEPAAQIFKTPSRRLPYINLRTSPLTCSHFHRTFLTSRSWKTSPSAPLAVEPVPLSSLQTRTTEDSKRDGPCRIRARILSYESEDTLENTRLLLQCTSASPPPLIPPVPSLASQSHILLPRMGIAQQLARQRKATARYRCHWNGVLQCGLLHTQRQALRHAQSTLVFPEICGEREKALQTIANIT